MAFERPWSKSLLHIMNNGETLWSSEQKRGLRRYWMSSQKCHPSTFLDLIFGETPQIFAEKLPIFGETLPLPSSCSPFFIWTINNKNSLWRERKKRGDEASSCAGLLHYSTLRCIDFDVFSTQTHCRQAQAGQLLIILWCCIFFKSWFIVSAASCDHIDKSATAHEPWPRYPGLATRMKRWTIQMDFGTT